MEIVATMDLYRRVALTIVGLSILVALTFSAVWLFGSAADAGNPPCVPNNQEIASLRGFFPGIYAVDLFAVLGGALCYWLALQQQWFLGHGNVRWLVTWALTSVASLALILALYEISSPCMEEAVWGVERLALPPYSSNAIPFIGGFWTGRLVDIAFLSAASIWFCQQLRTRSLRKSTLD
jgi:hypothetical protein